jgi:hypothetical protein
MPRRTSIIGRQRAELCDASTMIPQSAAVEPLGKGAVHVGGREAAILLDRRHRPMVGDLGEHPLQEFVRPGLHLDERVARVVPRLADRDVQDAERAAMGRDRVQHFGQDQAVDDVAGDLHFLDVERAGLGRRDRFGRHDRTTVRPERQRDRLSDGPEKPYTAGSPVGLARPTNGESHR